MRDLPAGWTFSGEEVGATTTLLVERLRRPGHRAQPDRGHAAPAGHLRGHGRARATRRPHPAICAQPPGCWSTAPTCCWSTSFLHHPLTDEQRALYQQLADNSQPYQFQRPRGHHRHGNVSARPVEEISTLAHKLHDLYEPDGLFMLVQMGDYIQLVARSTSDAIDVGKIAGGIGRRRSQPRRAPR